MLVVGIAIAAALPLPILPLQILYLNLVTDVFPAFALAMGEGERDTLQRRPRDPEEQILGRAQWRAILLQSIPLAGGIFAALGLARSAGLTGEAVVTTTFLTMAFVQLWHVFDIRGSRSGVILNEVTRNPWIWAALGLCSALLAIPPYLPPLAEVLHVAPPTEAMWGVVAGCSLAPMVGIQLGRVIVGFAQRGR